MKKFKITLVALFSMMSILFVGCEKSTESDSDSILGAWEYSLSEVDGAYTFDYKETMTFASDGSLSLAYTYQFFDSAGAEVDSGSDVEYATYKYSGGKLSVYSEDETITVDVVISGDTLTIYSNDAGVTESLEYTKVK